MRADHLIRAVTDANQRPGFQTQRSLIEIGLDVGNGQRDVVDSFERHHLSSSGGALDPPDGLVGEFVEGGHGQGEVFFFGVFDFVVADAVEALDEHHDGGDAELSDGGGVVKWAGGEAMGFGAGVGDGFVAEGDEIGVEKDRLDLPEAFPGNGDVAFFREAFAGFLRFGKHAGERGGVEMALIERDPAFFDDAGDDAGFRCA